MRASGLALLVLPLFVVIAGCTPLEWRPLDRVPRGPRLFHTSRDGWLRYDGREEPWADKQPAGDLESRVVTFEASGSPDVVVAAVATFGTRAYFDELRALADAPRADAVVCAVEVMGLARRPPDDAATTMRDLARALRDDLAFVTFALAPDERFVRPKPTERPEDVELRRPLDPLVAGRLIGAVEEHGADLVLHGLVLDLLEARGRLPEVQGGPVANLPRLEPARPPEDRRATLVRTFLEQRLRDACVASIREHGQARRVLVLALPETAGALARELVKGGARPVSERWLTAIPIRSRR